MSDCSNATEPTHYENILEKTLLLCKLIKVSEKLSENPVRPLQDLIKFLWFVFLGHLINKMRFISAMCVMLLWEEIILPTMFFPTDA